MSEERTSPAIPQIMLLVAFLVITAIGVVTVVVPELRDDAEETEDGDAATPEQAPEDEPEE